jgi:hypothetical protein
VGKVPFSVYDFFAYLSSGVVIIAATDYIWNAGLLTRKEVAPVLAVALIFLAYVLGHIVAHFSAWILENGVAIKFLRPPSASLMGAEPRWKILKLIFRGYHHPLSKTTQERIVRQAAARNCTAAAEGLFQHIYPIVTQNERYQSRLDEFRNQYGFARNVSLAFIVSSVAIFVAYYYGPHPVRLRWAVLSGIAGITLFYRYLKFFRQYSYELFLRYSQLPLDDPKTKNE